MRFFLHWGCLLIFALVTPIALPAGGGVRRKAEVIYTKGNDFGFAGDSCFLVASPFLKSPSLCQIKLGTPLRVIRFWENEDGKKWIQVQRSSINLIDFHASSANRGWIHG